LLVIGRVLFLVTLVSLFFGLPTAWSITASIEAGGSTRTTH
jgi:hypothetical protein